MIDTDFLEGDYKESWQKIDALRAFVVRGVLVSRQSVKRWCLRDGYERYVLPSTEFGYPSVDGNKIRLLGESSPNTP